VARHMTSCHDALRLRAHTGLLMKDTAGLTMRPTLAPIGASDGPALGVVMALHVLGPIEGDQFVELCHVAGYDNGPMGFFEETWRARRIRAGRPPAYALLQGGKNANEVELSDRCRDEWIPGLSLRDRVRGARRLPRLLDAAEAWLAKRGDT
jgi:hypothetical protein